MMRLTVLIASTVFAASAWAAGISVSDAWVRHLPGGAPAGAFFTLQNQSKAPVTLLAASSPEYGMVTIHKSIEEGGISKMTSVDQVEVPPGRSVLFRPGGYHLMLMHAKHDIKVGSRIPITLEFSGAQKITAQFDVRGPTAK